MNLILEEVQLDHVGAYKYEGDNFIFTALCLSDEFACEYVMDILIDQTPNTNITYRHRHSLSSDTIIPIFGKAGKAEKVSLEFKGKNRLFMRGEYIVPLKSPNGIDLDDNIIYAEWIKKSYEEGTPAGISYHFQTRIKNGKAYMANLLEIAGTPYPRCKECLNVLPQTGEEILNEEDRKKMLKMDAAALQGLLESTTTKLEIAEKELEDKAKSLTKLEDETKSLGVDLEKNIKELEASRGDSEKAMKMVQELSANFTTLKLDYEFERTKGPLVRQIITLENRPELESFYRAQEEDYLKKRLESLSQPKPEISNMNPAFLMQRAKRELESGDDLSPETIMSNLSPNLRKSYKELIDRRGE